MKNWVSEHIHVVFEDKLDVFENYVTYPEHWHSFVARLVLAHVKCMLQELQYLRHPVTIVLKCSPNSTLNELKSQLQ